MAVFHLKKRKMTKVARYITRAGTGKGGVVRIRKRGCDPAGVGRMPKELTGDGIFLAIVICFSLCSRAMVPTSTIRAGEPAVLAVHGWSGGGLFDLLDALKLARIEAGASDRRARITRAKCRTQRRLGRTCKRICRECVPDYLASCRIENIFVAAMRVSYGIHTLGRMGKKLLTL